MKTLFVVWQDPETRSWHPVARLKFESGVYTFCYTRGARVSPRFRPFGRLSELERVYRSKTLYPFFLNRVLDEARPEFPAYLRWLDLNPENPDPIEMLDRTGGQRETDNLAVVSCPEPNELGVYTGFFFCHGIRHLPSDGQKRADLLRSTERLFPLYDIQNPFDPHAVAFRTNDPTTLVGYCPRYRARDVRRLVDSNPLKPVEFWVEKINLDAPLQLRVLIGIRAVWPEGFQACVDDEYRPLPFDGNDDEWPRLRQVAG